MRKEQVLTLEGGGAMRQWCFTYQHNSGARIVAYCIGLEKYASGYIDALFEVRYEGKEAEEIIERWINTYGYYDAREKGIFERHMIEDLVKMLETAFPGWLGFWWFMDDYEKFEKLAKEVKRKSGKSWLELSDEIRNEGDIFYVIQYLNKYLEGNEKWECTVDQKLHYVAQFIIDYIAGRALDEKLHREIEKNYRR
jgi:hypothetical protein